MEIANDRKDETFWSDEVVPVPEGTKHKFVLPIDQVGGDHSRSVDPVRQRIIHSFGGSTVDLRYRPYRARAYMALAALSGVS